MTAPKPKRAPVAPKAYGALGGAGTGAAVAAVIVGLIQDYVTHGKLSAAAVQAIYAVVPFVLAFAGAYLMPHQPRPADSPAPDLIIRTPKGHMSSHEL